jgi:Predicted hydrolase of alkaline phosphatase superfamily
MQRSSLPLSYPLTARHLLERYGFIAENDYRNRTIQEGNPFAIAIEYPLDRISFDEKQNKQNVLIINIDGWNNQLLANNMPWLKEFSNQNINFINHYAASSQAYLNNFSLFYGLDPNYYNSILAGHKTSVLFDTVTKQHYNLGLFSADGFSEPLYRYALLSNFSIPDGKKQSNKLTTDYWMAWHDEQNKLENHAPLFSVIQYSLVTKNKKIPVMELESEAKKLDQYLESLIAYLKLSNAYEDTIIIITGSNDLKIDEAKKLVSHNTENSFNREALKVPLIISWPGREIKQISTITSQTDILRTLMQDAFNVTTPAQQYSQGRNLFNQSTREWILAGSENQIAALYDHNTVVIDAFGRSKIYDLNGKQLKGEKISLPIFLQIVTENRRFIVVDN